jgi:protein-tyrosine-phosphatase
MTERTVLFVCEHGAGKSRIAAAWFNSAPPAGWHATTAGVEPQSQPSAHAPRLLAGTYAESMLDHTAPRPISAVPDPTLVVSIDCTLPDAVQWQLRSGGSAAPIGDSFSHAA